MLIIIIIIIIIMAKILVTEQILVTFRQLFLYICTNTDEKENI